jgi:hypothetical protein
MSRHHIADQPAGRRRWGRSVRARLSRSLERLTIADYHPLLHTSADEVRLRCPGDHAWSVDLEGRSELERWLQSYVGIGLRIAVDEAVSSGFPWRRTIVIRGAADLATPAGDIAYANRFVLWARVAWRHCTDYEIYEDTQRTAALDTYLMTRGRPVRRPPGR